MTDHLPRSTLPSDWIAPRTFAEKMNRNHTWNPCGYQAVRHQDLLGAKSSSRPAAFQRPLRQERFFPRPCDSLRHSSPRLHARLRAGNSITGTRPVKCPGGIRVL